MLEVDLLGRPDVGGRSFARRVEVREDEAGNSTLTMSARAKMAAWGSAVIP